MYSDSADNADTDQPTREYNQQQYIARTRQSRQYNYQQQRRGFIHTQKTSMPSSRTIKSKQSFDVPPSSSRNISGGSSSNHTPQHSSNNDFITPRNRTTQHNTHSEPHLPHHHHNHHRVVAPHTDPTGGVVVSSRSGNRRRTSMLRTRNESNLVVDSTTMSSSNHGLSSSYRRKSKTTGHNSHHNSSNSSLTETPHRYNSHRNSNSSRNKKKVKESPMIGFYSNSKSYLPRNTSFSFTTPYPFVLASSSESNNSCDPYPYSNSPNYEGYNHSHHHSHSGERGMMTMDSASSNSNTFSPSSSSTTTPRSLFRDMSDSAHSSSSNRYNMMNRMFVWKTRNLYRVLLPFLLVSGVVCTFMVSSDLYLHTQVSLTRKNRSSSVSAAGARVLYLNNELHNHKKAKTKTGAFPVPKQRTVQEYPTEFSDNTQLYGILDSSDPALALMEIREPHTDEKKGMEPLAKWQTQFHPSCNDMHTLDFAEPEQFAELFGTKGYWRHAWHVANEFSSEVEDHVVVKTLKYEHNFEDAHFEHDRIDAVAMERLTSSPHVINIYGFCGHSVVTEYADGKRLGSLADKQKHHPEILLQIALDIANGMNDIHTISIEDGDEERGFSSKGDMNTFVHLDVNPANVVSVGGTLKFNDFNIGIMRKWNRTSSSLAGFPAQYPNPQWRSPEEAANSQTLNEKVDIFSMGHIFFRLICGHEPWNKLEIDPPQPTKDQINEKVKQGILPHIPEEIMESKDFAVVAIREAMLKCYTFDPHKRPSAKEIARGLDKALEKLKKVQKKEKEEKKRKDKEKDEKKKKKLVVHEHKKK